MKYDEQSSVITLRNIYSCNYIIISLTHRLMFQDFHLPLVIEIVQ
jgi:hypothetical protein